ncbi:MAG: ATP-dependent RNA helicase HrpA [Chromatiales bacterium]|nr:MAG: ATP-dependent RNA helicase HrpA [Chromatiales bacterium]
MPAQSRDDEAAAPAPMCRDRHSVARLEQRIARRESAGRPVAREREELQRLLRLSAQAFEHRRAAVPKITYPSELPIAARHEELGTMIAANQVVIVCGETGSGKSTQLPKICLDLGLGVSGMIGHTQPRRIAARAVAARVAEETGMTLGKGVGFKLRFSDQTDASTLVKVMTDGILLAEMQRERLFESYDTLIIDEAHERSLNIDFLLGYLRRILPQRPDLKLIITSATIDIDKFSQHFDNAPVMEISGRSYPVEIRYRDESHDGDGADLADRIVAALAGLPRDDALVFLPGERDIRDTAERLRRAGESDSEILPLFARLSAAEQARVFKSGPARRIVLATNVAETSLTVPGIRFVIDSGLARHSRYSYRSKIQRLPVEPISQSSAAQRAGRCGRVRAGICVRLYSEEDFEQRPEFTDAEILRTNLASVILRMADLGLGQIDEFPFIDAPDPRYVRDGYRLLRELQAVDASGKITRLGRKLARFPVDPMLARIILAGASGQALREVLTIVAALSIRDPRERPAEKAQEADRLHAEFDDPRSDFVGLLDLWREWSKVRKERSGSQQRKWCSERFISFLRMREWADIHQQLRVQARDLGLQLNAEPASYEQLHTALLSGFVGHIGKLDEDKIYNGPRSTRFRIFPGSGLAARPPAWVMAASLVETSRVYARPAASVAPEWIERAAAHLVTRTYSEPHWQARPGRVVATETVTLYGLILVAGRRVAFGRIDPGRARDMFIEAALVRDDSPLKEKFLDENRALIARIADIEARERAGRHLVDEARIAAFFDARIPRDVVDVAGFRRWWKKAAKQNPRLLCLAESDVVDDPAQLEFDHDLFPAVIELGGATIPVTYRFEPGSENDGPVLHVPLPALAQINEIEMAWLVPGMLREKIVAWLRGLPKRLRRNFVPVPDFADACLPRLKTRDGDLRQALCRELESMTGVALDPAAFDELALPQHLRFYIQVEDEKGRVVAGGRDLAGLRSKLSDLPRAIAAPDDSAGWQRGGVTQWDFGEIPAHLSVRHGGHDLRLFPALRDRGDSVELCLEESADAAQRVTHDGVLRLFILKMPREYRQLRKEFIGDRALQLGCLVLQSSMPMDRVFAERAFELAFLPEDLPAIRDADGFDARLRAGRGDVFPVALDLRRALSAAIAGLQQVRERLDALAERGFADTVDDIRTQTDGLFAAGFLRAVSVRRLEHYERYLTAALWRLEKLEEDPRRDYRRLDEIRPFQQALEELLALDEPYRSLDAVRSYAWLLQEYRVSVFAQHLGTAEPASAKRLRRQWREVRKALAAAGAVTALLDALTPP